MTAGNVNTFLCRYFRRHQFAYAHWEYKDSADNARNAQTMALISNKDPDIFCLQECSKTLYDVMRDDEGFGYTLCYAARKERLEGLCIGVKNEYKSRLGYEVSKQLISDEKENQIILLRKFKISNQSHLLIATSHITGSHDKGVQQAQIKSAFKWLEAFSKQNDIVVFCGDFNFVHSGQPYEFISNATIHGIPVSDAKPVALSSSPTFFTNQNQVGKELDYLLYTNDQVEPENISDTEKETFTFEKSKKFVSDHYPVMVRFVKKREFY